MCCKCKVNISYIESLGIEIGLMILGRIRIHLRSWIRPDRTGDNIYIYWYRYTQPYFYLFLHIQYIHVYTCIFIYMKDVLFWDSTNRQGLLNYGLHKVVVESFFGIEFVLNIHCSEHETCPNFLLGEWNSFLNQRVSCWFQVRCHFTFQTIIYGICLLCM